VVERALINQLRPGILLKNHFKAKTKTMIKRLLTAHIAIVLLIGLAPASLAQTPVKNIVLVHGAFADGSGWEGIYKVLKSKGYNVSIVGNPNTGMPDDVAAVKRVLDRLTGPVILVGHSYGGAIITEAGNDPKVAGLVYIAAFVPAGDETLLKLLQSGPPAPNSGILPPDKNGYIWYDTAKFHSGFCADLSKEQASFMAASQVPVSASVFGYSFKEPAWKTKPAWYIVATEDQTIPPPGQHFMAKRAGAKVTEIKGSHLAFMVKPAEAAAVIETAAKEAAK
jgi:pimeloyl-ACP methyl ester carboxylesterase